MASPPPISILQRLAHWAGTRPIASPLKIHQTAAERQLLPEGLSPLFRRNDMLK